MKLSIVIPCFKNNHDLGLICPSYPEGIAKLMPVGIAYLSKVDKLIFSELAVYRSRPAAPIV